MAWANGDSVVELSTLGLGGLLDALDCLLEAAARMASTRITKHNRTKA